MSDPKKEDAKSDESSRRPPSEVEKDDGELPEDLKIGAEPEGNVEKLVERGRQMGF